MGRSWEDASWLPERCSQSEVKTVRGSPWSVVGCGVGRGLAVAPAPALRSLPQLLLQTREQPFEKYLSTCFPPPRPPPCSFSGAAATAEVVPPRAPTNLPLDDGSDGSLCDWSVATVVGGGRFSFAKDGGGAKCNERGAARRSVASECHCHISPTSSAGEPTQHMRSRLAAAAAATSSAHAVQLPKYYRSNICKVTIETFRKRLISSLLTRHICGVSVFCGTNWQAVG